MAHLSGNFSSPHAGLLDVTLEGTYEQGVSRDAGFPSGTSNMLIRASVNGNKTQAIDRYAPTVKGSFQYPGGNVVWPVTTEMVAYQAAGTTIFGFKNLKISAVLIKVTGS